MLSKRAVHSSISLKPWSERRIVLRRDRIEWYDPQGSLKNTLLFDAEASSVQPWREPLTLAVTGTQVGYAEGGLRQLRSSQRWSISSSMSLPASAPITLVLKCPDENQLEVY